jgi:hypothetical protein
MFIYIGRIIMSFLNLTIERVKDISENVLKTSNHRWPQQMEISLGTFRVLLHKDLCFP